MSTSEFDTAGHPFIRSVTVEGFRGYSEPRRLDLAVPDNRRLGSGLTIVVGANNTGKSSLLEALFLLNQLGTTIELSQERRNAAYWSHTRLQFELGLASRVELRAAQPGGPTLGWIWSEKEDGMHLPPLVYGVPAERPPSEQTLSETGMSRLDYVRSFSGNFREQSMHNFGMRLGEAHKKRDVFDGLVSSIVGAPFDWTLNKHPTNPSGFRTSFRGPGNAPHALEGLGKGVARALQLVDALYDAAPGEIIIIDEPEQSLHPAAQRQLAMLLAEESLNKQIVLATHSPVFLQWHWLESGARLARTYAEDRGVPSVAMLPTEQVHQIAGLLSDQHNLHTLGNDAKEAFFQTEPLILVEGQEDVWGYERIATELGITLPGRFFGWGVGGVGRMASIARMLAALRFRQVVGILDGGQEATAEKLRREFRQYRFVVSPVEDVRSKPERPSLAARRGLLNGNRLREDMRQPALRLLEEVSDALKSAGTEESSARPS